MWVIVILVPSTCCLLFKRSRSDAERREMMSKVETLKNELIGGKSKSKRDKKSTKATNAKGGEAEDTTATTEAAKGEEEEESDE